MCNGVAMKLMKLSAESASVAMQFVLTTLIRACFVVFEVANKAGSLQDSKWEDFFS